MAVFGTFRVATRYSAVLATVGLIGGLSASVMSAEPALAAAGDITTTAAGLAAPWGIASAGGNLFVTQNAGNQLSRIDPSGGVTTLVGGAPLPLGDGGAASAATLQLARESKVAFDAAGNMYIAESGRCRVRRVDHATGIISTVAGNGTGCDGFGGYSGEGGLATDATLIPQGVAVDAAGDLYITTFTYGGGVYTGRVLKVDHATGIITTIAGGGSPADGFGDGGLATAANLHSPVALAFDAAGNLFIADIADGRVRRIDHTTGIITTLTLKGVAPLQYPGDLTFGGSSLFIADFFGSRVVKVNLNSGQATNVAGGGSPADGVGDGGPAVAAAFDGISAIAWRAGHLYISDLGHNRVRVVDLRTGIITTIAGTGVAGDRGDGLPATQAQLSAPTGLVFDAAGNLFVLDTGNGRVRRIDHATGIITTVAGGGIGDGLPGTQASLSGPRGVVVDASGNILIADCGDHRVRMLAPNGIITTVVGGGTPGDGVGDDGPATAAALDCPSGLALVTSGANTGTLYIADAGSNRVRKVDANGIITTVAGTGNAGVAGDSGPATGAQLNGPSDVTVDGAGQLFIADTNNNRVRKVDAAGVISTVAGDGIAGLGRDGVKATQSHVTKPTGVTFDGHGSLVIAEQGFARVRKVDLATGIITTIAGTGIPGFTGDGGPATSAELNAPTQVAFDAAANMYITDMANGRVRRVEPGTIPPPNKGCAQVITKNTKLHADVGPCPIDGIVIGADNITLDLNGYQVLGIGHMADADDAPAAAGIRIAQHKGVTVAGTSKPGGPQGGVTGFQDGVAIIGGSGNTITNVNVHDNIGPLSEGATFGDGIGIFYSAGNKLIANQIVHNGIYDGIGVLGVGSDRNLIQNNTITNTFSGVQVCGCNGAGEGTAIVLNPFLEAGLPRMVSIYSNQMIGNTVSNNDNAGISNISNVNGVIKNNVVEHNDITPGGYFGGPFSYPGNGIGVSHLANAAGDTNVLVQGNQVHDNAANGILVSSSGNRIMNNNAAFNHVFGDIIGSYDLADESGCANVWNNNTYGPPPQGFEVGCETAGGHEVPGPQPAPAASSKAPAVQPHSVPSGSLTNPAPRGHPANPAG